MEENKPKKKRERIVRDRPKSPIALAIDNLNQTIRTEFEKNPDLIIEYQRRSKDGKILTKDCGYPYMTLKFYNPLTTKYKKK